MPARSVSMKILTLFVLAACSSPKRPSDNNEKETPVRTEIKQKGSSSAAVNEAPQGMSQTGIGRIEKETPLNSLIQEAADDLHLENEELLLSFQTEGGKTLYIGIDKQQRYMVYRFGKRGKVELQHPKTVEGSFDRFTYGFHLRGGGPENEGLDLNHLTFTGATHKFVVYEEYNYTPTGRQEVAVGLRVINLKTKRETDIKGRAKTIKGTLIGLRDNELVKTEDGGT
jgi:hypothetical protein